MNHEANHSSMHQENVDLSEITKFNAIATRWWKLNGELKLLHRMNPLRLDYILNRAGGLFGKNILDIGCGGGILAESMAREGAKVTGLDMSAVALEVARSHALDSGVKIKYIQQTVEQHAQTNFGMYDIVTCMEMLEHVPNPASIVHNSARLVSPAGDVFFSTINRNCKAWLMVIFGAEYLLSLIPCGTHDINHFIKPSELLNWVDETSLCERHITGIHYSPRLDEFKLSNNLDINYMLHTQRIK
ncbi:bifunctional 3-demethylubiquinol 3-O-methyltransferase/2-polyprenyl-6-hydroxyphenol methylase [Candidatus Palibaumannia cicadellinicola]|uniref:Ubiquinone biosynthesis O-methyltransferase n=1 Tax=Candidatus Palibaumannia cicadellinicola TaxID=186490 RepID=A0A2N4XWR8_9GAMM|nr:bifunctional 2-polyprenyl-6-hydroxyphenol methylase/3-demethylubiquinol 3-O-methyltransferase UbiG [Candidatus Baumannia cicadellinicola]PLK58565.1 bifunctional 3-demethylubiquinol 3-O-methyltransferase/2-polyprenyl-6-hydroxyphenol methylase [Candidatus Baumannia cicadellinicola]